MEKNKQSQEMIHAKATLSGKLHQVFPWQKSAQDNISGFLFNFSENSQMQNNLLKIAEQVNILFVFYKKFTEFILLLSDWW